MQRFLHVQHLLQHHTNTRNKNVERKSNINNNDSDNADLTTHYFHRRYQAEVNLPAPSNAQRVSDGVSGLEKGAELVVHKVHLEVSSTRKITSIFHFFGAMAIPPTSHVNRHARALDLMKYAAVVCRS